MPTTKVTFPTGDTESIRTSHEPNRALIGRLNGVWKVAVWLLPDDSAPTYLNFYRDGSSYTDLRVVSATKV